MANARPFDQEAAPGQCFEVVPRCLGRHPVSLGVRLGCDAGDSAGGHTLQYVGLSKAKIRAAIGKQGGALAVPDPALVNIGIEIVESLQQDIQLVMDEVGQVTAVILGQLKRPSVLTGGSAQDA